MEGPELLEEVVPLFVDKISYFLIELLVIIEMTQHHRVIAVLLPFEGVQEQLVSLK